MSARPPECPRCKVAMAKGVAIDHAHYGIPTRPVWIAGEVERGWLGDKLPSGKRWHVTTWRCPSCGLLESYASHP